MRTSTPLVLATSFTVLSVLAGCLGRRYNDAAVKEKLADPSIPASKKAIVPPSAEARDAIIRRAKTWMPPDRGGRSLLEGPAQKKAENQFTHNQDFRCKYKEPDETDPPGGKTPKFWCLDPAGNDFKVKYQSAIEYNSGIYGETLSTRLMWAIGFPADSMYPVKVTCENCPEAPWRHITAFFDGDRKKVAAKVAAGTPGPNLPRDDRRLWEYLNQPRAERVFPETAIEIKIKGAREIEMFEDQGWSWEKDFDLVGDDPEVRRQRDALALFAAFIQHADNKAEQQRLICLDSKEEESDTDCKNPYLMLQDVGFTFGSGWVRSGVDKNGRIIGDGTKAELNGFKEALIWLDAAKCITKVHEFATGAKADKPVSEAGRLFLVEKLNLMTDDDLRQLFTSANLQTNRDFKSNAPLPGTVDDWVAAFKAKRAALEAHRCLS